MCARRGVGAARALPGKAGGEAVARRLGGAQAVERRRRAAGAHLGVGEAVAGGEVKAADLDAAVELDAAADDGIDILAHPKLAAGGDEADAGEGARPLAQRHIGDGVGEPVGEEGQADACRAGGRNSRPASTPRRRSGASAALAAVASAPTRNGR